MEMPEWAHLEMEQIDFQDFAHRVLERNKERPILKFQVLARAEKHSKNIKTEALQDIVYYSRPKSRQKKQSLDEAFGSVQQIPAHVLQCTYFMTGVEPIRNMLLYCEPSALEHVQTALVGCRWILSFQIPLKSWASRLRSRRLGGALWFVGILLAARTKTVLESLPIFYNPIDGTGTSRACPAALGQRGGGCRL